MFGVESTFPTGTPVTRAIAIYSNVFKGTCPIRPLPAAACPVCPETGLLQDYQALLLQLQDATARACNKYAKLLDKGFG